MKLDKIKLNQLKPAEYNPRQISDDDFKKLSNNLKKFGLVDPIVINLKNMHIIGGHQRYSVLLKEKPETEFNLLKLGDIGWVFDSLDLSLSNEQEEKALNISLNKISGEWDYDKLSSLLSELQSFDFDMDLTGFNSMELSSFQTNDNVFFNEEIFKLEQASAEAGAGSDEDEEVLVNTDDVNKFKCPKCGHEW